MFLRLKSTVTPGFRLPPGTPGSATWLSLSSALRSASRASATTCDGGKGSEADRFVLEATLRKVGIGGVGVGPFDVADEFGIGLRPPEGFSGTFLAVAGIEAPGIRSGRSMPGYPDGDQTAERAGIIWISRRSSDRSWPLSGPYTRKCESELPNSSLERRFSEPADWLTGLARAGQGLGRLIREAAVAHGDRRVRRRGMCLVELDVSP